jgi:DNA-binding FadR family transcriptional regulator
MKPISSGQITKRVQEELANYLASEKFRPGDRLPSLREITQRLGVSQTSVREGLRALEALGLVEIRHGSGIYVANGLPPLRPLSGLLGNRMRGDRLARELLAVRLAVEPEVCSLAAVHATESDLAKLSKHVEDFRRDVGKIERPASDIGFHLDLCRAAHHEAFMAIMEWIAQFYATSRKVPELHDVEDHARILTALRRRDGETARLEMTKHLQWIGTFMKGRSRAALHDRRTQE